MIFLLQSEYYVLFLKILYASITVYIVKIIIICVFLIEKQNNLLCALTILARVGKENWTPQFMVIVSYLWNKMYFSLRMFSFSFFISETLYFHSFFGNR